MKNESFGDLARRAAPSSELSLLRTRVPLESAPVVPERGTSQQGVRYSLLDRAAAELVAAVDGAAAGDIELARAEYVRLVLAWSAERPELARGQFLSMLFGLSRNIQKRHLIGYEAAPTADDLSSELEAETSVDGVVEAFEAAVSRLLVVASSALEGPRSARLATTLQYLKDNFAEPLPLTTVARKAGFSVPAFRRVFKQVTGTSFLVYLRNVRVQRALALLSTTTLSAEQIARACGFQSQHHLIRCFKKVTKRTPGSYRRDTLAAAAGHAPDRDAPVALRRK
jgi:AraC-like DNA-binding protein